MLTVNVTKQQSYLFELEAEIELKEVTLEQMVREYQRFERLRAEALTKNPTMKDRVQLEVSGFNLREIMGGLRHELLYLYETYRMVRTNLEFRGVFSTIEPAFFHYALQRA